MNNDELLIVIKELFDKKTDEIKQYVDDKINGQGALIESLHSDIKAVAEGHDILNRKIDEGHETLNRKIDEGYSILNRKIDGVKEDLGKRIDEVKQDVKSLKSDMNVVKDYIIGVDAKLNEHEIILKRVK